MTGAVNWPAIISGVIATIAAAGGVTQNRMRDTAKQRGDAAVMVVKTLTGSIEELVMEREMLRIRLDEAEREVACP